MSWLSLQAFETICALLALACAVTCVRMGTQVPSAEAAATAAKPSATLVQSLPDAVQGGQGGEGEQPTSTVPMGIVSSSVASACISKGAELKAWNRALRERDQGTRTEPLRILWFGDSHAAADYWPGAVRNALASVMPSAGPGYLSLGVPHSRHGMARLSQQGAIEVSPHPPARRSVEGDGAFGLGGTRVTLKDATGTVSVKLAYDGMSQYAVHCALHFRASDRTDRMLLTVGKEQRRFGIEDATEQVGGLFLYRFEMDGSTEFSIQAERGKPQLFGVIAETNLPGYVIDTLGINGARLGTFLAWDRGMLSALVASRKPLIAVVAYGTNEVFDDEKVSRHVARLEEVVGRLRDSVPDIGCLIAGPTDVDKGTEETRERVALLDEAMRQKSEGLGCGYFSAYEVMKRNGGARVWREQDPPLAVSDGVHLTARGYARLGESFAAQCLGVHRD